QAELALMRERHDIAHALALAPRAALCAGGSDDFADLLRETGDLAGAAREYRHLLALDPEREGWKARLAQTLAASRSLADAERLRAGLGERHRGSSRYRLRLADLAVARGDEPRARRLLEAGLGEIPESRDLERGRAALCSASRPVAAETRLTAAAEKHLPAGI